MFHSSSSLTFNLFEISKKFQPSSRRGRPWTQSIIGPLEINARIPRSYTHSTRRACVAVRPHSFRSPTVASERMQVRDEIKYGDEGDLSMARPVSQRHCMVVLSFTRGDEDRPTHDITARAPSAIIHGLTLRNGNPKGRVIKALGRE